MGLDLTKEEAAKLFVELERLWNLVPREDQLLHSLTDCRDANLKLLVYAEKEIYEIYDRQKAGEGEVIKPMIWPFSGTEKGVDTPL